MPCARRLCAILEIRVAIRYLGPSSRFGVRRIAACHSLNTSTVSSPCVCNVSLFSIATPSASRIAHCLASNTSIRPAPRSLWPDFHPSLCLYTAAAPTRPSLERDPSVHHIQTPAPTFASFYLGQRCAALLAVVALSSMMVLTTESSPGAGQFMPSVARACACSSLNALHTGVLEQGSWCRFLNL
jgi:hypothetical protein